MDIAIRTYNGKDTGRKIELTPEIFEIKPSDHSIYLDIKRIMANLRQGTSKTKERSEIKGSTRKLRKQKGTGRARVGSIKNPLFRGGGRIFGPRVRSYSLKINKKVRNLARKSALSYKAIDNAISVIEEFDFETPKTKQYIKLLNALSLHDKKTLLILSKNKKNILLAGRNIPHAKVITDDQINTYDVLNADQLIFVEPSLKKLNDALT